MTAEFAVNVDIEPLAGDSAKQTLYITTNLPDGQAVIDPDGKVIFDNNRVEVTGSGSIVLPSNENLPAGIVYHLHRNGGTVRDWWIPAQNTGASVDLSDFTQAINQPVTDTVAEAIVAGDAATLAAANAYTDGHAGGGGGPAYNDGPIYAALAAELAARQGGDTTNASALAAETIRATAAEAANATAIGLRATAAQGAKADTAVQPAGLTKAAIGLGSVDNTSDALKPVSGPQATAISTAVNNLVNSAPGTLDTLGEIAAQLATDESGVAALTTTVAGKLAKASNLSDLGSVTTARTNLGLGSAATQPSGAFDAAGAATAAQSAAATDATNKVGTETTRAQGAETANATAISNEVTRATGVESGKQASLVSGTNIKTVNGVSVLGAGNLAAIPAGGTTGQRLEKKTGTDYDTQWATPSTATLPGPVAYSIPSDVAVTTAPTGVAAFSFTLPVGTWSVALTATILAGGAVAADVYLQAGTAVLTTSGPSGTTYKPVNGATANIAFSVQVTVTTAGTVNVMHATNVGTTHTFKAQGVNAAFSATGVTARCVSVP